MAVIYAGEYQQKTPEQQALLYAAGYRYTDQYVISQEQKHGMVPLTAPWRYQPGITETELAQRTQAQREQEYRTALELRQYREASRQSFGGTFTPSSLAMVQAPIGTDISSEIQRMPKEQEQIGLKLRYLQSPTAEWRSEAEFKKYAAGVERFAPSGMEFKGMIVSEPILLDVPTTSQFGFTQPGGIYKAFEERRLREQYPSTPIDYSKTHVSELYSFPLYKGAAFVSRGLEIGVEKVISLFPEPEPQKEIQKGVSSLITGIPVFLASGLAGYEYAVREPKVFKEGIVPASKMFGAGLVQQATERPYYTLGQAAGIGYGMRGMIPKMKIPEVFKGRTAYTPEAGMREVRPSETRTVDLSTEFRRPVFPETEGTPLPRTTYPYGMAFAEKITYPKGFELTETIKPTISKAPEIVKPLFPELEGTPLPRSTYPYGMAYAERVSYPKSYKFKIIGKGIKYEAWGEKPISPTEYFGSITRGRFMLEREVAGTDKIFGGRYRKGEIDPWAGKPTIRQSAEARGEKLKRTITQPKIKAIEPIGGTELKYGRQSLIAVMEEPKPITKTIQVQKTKAVLMPVALTQYRQKTVSLTIPKTQQRAITSQTQMMRYKPISISRQVSSQVSGFVMAYPTTSIQVPKAAQRQVYRTEQAFKPIQRAVSISTPMMIKIQKPKTKSIDIFPSITKRKRRRGGFMFPELTRVATPKQIMKGFRL